MDGDDDVDARGLHVDGDVTVLPVVPQTSTRHHHSLALALAHDGVYDKFVPDKAKAASVPLVHFVI